MITRILTAIAVAGLGQCSPAPAPPVESGPSAHIVIIDCGHVEYVGSGFAPGSELWLAFGADLAGGVVGPDGTFDIPGTRSTGAGFGDAATADIRQWAINFHVGVDVPACPIAGCN